MLLMSPSHMGLKSTFRHFESPLSYRSMEGTLARVFRLHSHLSRRLAHPHLYRRAHTRTNQAVYATHSPYVNESPRPPYGVRLVLTQEGRLDAAFPKLRSTSPSHSRRPPTPSTSPPVGAGSPALGAPGAFAFFLPTTHAPSSGLRLFTLTKEGPACPPRRATSTSRSTGTLAPARPTFSRSSFDFPLRLSRSTASCHRPSQTCGLSAPPSLLPGHRGSAKR